MTFDAAQPARQAEQRARRSSGEVRARTAAAMSLEEWGHAETERPATVILQVADVATVTVDGDADGIETRVIVLLEATDEQGQLRSDRVIVGFRAGGGAAITASISVED